jgi:hypothetical protein
MSEQLVLISGGRRVIVQGDDNRVLVDEIRVVSVAEQGPPGRNGDAGGDGSNLTYIAGGAIGGHRFVALDGDELRYAGNDAIEDASLTLGLSLNAAASGGDVEVQFSGPVFNAGWSWSPGLPVYLGTNGQLTQTPPAAPAVFALTVGHALAADTLNLRIGDPIIL